MQRWSRESNISGFALAHSTMQRTLPWQGGGLRQGLYLCNTACWWFHPRYGAILPWFTHCPGTVFRMRNRSNLPTKNKSLPSSPLILTTFDRVQKGKTRTVLGLVRKVDNRIGFKGVWLCEHHQVDHFVFIDSAPWYRRNAYSVKNSNKLLWIP